MATRVEATFADRTWSTASLEGAPCFRAFFLHHGRGVFVGVDGGPIELTAPQILWLPFEARGEFRLLAGGDGATLLASEDVVWRIVGENPLGAQLRPLIERTLLAPGPRLASSLSEIEALFDALARESRDPGPGAPAMTALYLGLLLMHLWRSCGLARESDSLDAGAPTAQRFRQLVELHYRDNLSVDDFSRLLGVTRAHLHNACLRTLGHAPQQLVHERLIAEARLRLRETAQPIEQVGYSLGFRDPAYFNRFFRRLSGLSPGAYRKAARVTPPREATSYAAWP
ncbi:MAG TPA: helix-turn-helix domain-containing protein [Roseiarcus sp.]|nr:helix-turn-helix domain-containing protein [Roseiarcus sp.]